MPVPAIADPPTDWAHVLEELWGRAHGEGDGAEPADAADTTEGAGTWAPPVGIGPIPAHLLDRAVEVRDAQSQAIASVRRAMDEVVSELSMVRSAPAQAAPSEPIYLDRLA